MSAIKSRLLARVCAAATAVLVRSAQASTLEAINHTHWAINRFSVDGRWASTSSARIKVAAEVAVTARRRDGSRGLRCVLIGKRVLLTPMASLVTQIRPKYLAWEKQIDAKTRRRVQIVPFPTTPVKKSVA